MARIRTIKPEFPQSETMGKVSREARLCFILLWTLADDAGRLRGNAKMLSSLLYPYDDDAKRLIEKWLSDLDCAGCIVRYEVGGNSYIQIVGWLDHQRIEKPSGSKLPAPPDSRTFQKIPEDSPPDQGEEGIKDQGMDQGDSAEAAASAQVVPLGPPIVCLPLVDKSEFAVTEAMVREWAGAYPGVDVPGQLRQMRVWCIANPTKCKTHRGIASFVVRWLGKAQDRSGSIPSGGSEPAWRKEQRERTQQAAPGVAVQNAADFFDVEANDVPTYRLG